MTIHKEGFASIFISALLLTLLNGAVYYLLPELRIVFVIILILSTVFFGLIVSFFRSPATKINFNKGHIISPADGKVVVIEEVEEGEYLKDKRIQVSVFMSPLNVHINRYPISGVVKFFKHHNGHFHVAWHPKSSTENERTTTVVEHKNGIEILFRQIAGAVARRIVSYAKVSSDVEQGSECGFIKFGSRVDVFLPLNAKVNVKIGDKVKGGISVLAEF